MYIEWLFVSIDWTCMTLSLRTRVVNLVCVCVFLPIKEKHKLSSFESFISLSSTNTALLLLKRTVMRPCNSLMTLFARARRANWKACVADDRLDTFLRSRMAANYPKAWSVCELALFLSHGQASVEREFSVNKELVVENQSEQTLAAKGSHYPC